MAIPIRPTPPRLQAIAALIPDWAGAVVDVGYDHGHLLRDLHRQAPDRVLIGVERQGVSRGRLLARHGDAGALDLRHGDGLQPLQPGEAEVVVIAGMGERTMLRILRDSPEVLARARRLVLCPTQMDAELRPAMATMGFAVVDERLCFEHGRWYLPLALEPSPAGPLPAGHRARYGPHLFARRDPNLPPYLSAIEEAFRDALEANLAGYTHPGTDRLTAQGAKLALLGAAISEARRFSPSPPPR